MPTSSDIHALLDDPETRERLLAALPAYLPRQRWFTSKGQVITDLAIRRLPRLSESGALVLLDIAFANGQRETRVLTLAFRERGVEGEGTEAVVELSGGILFDAMAVAGFRESLYTAMAGATEFRDASGRLFGEAGPLLTSCPRPQASTLPLQNSSNTVATYEPDGFLKLFRKVEPGLHPDAELIGYLSGTCHFAAVPTFGGALHFQPADGGEPYSLALMLGRVDHSGEAWFNILEDVAAFEQVYTSDTELQAMSLSDDLGLALRPGDLSTGLCAALGPDTVDKIVRLGRRTAEMHLHFAASADAGLQPEPLDEDYWRESKATLEARLQEQIDLAESTTAQQLRSLTDWIQQSEFPSYPGGRIRVHGDYHLGQVLDTTDGDVRIIDFEGEPLHSLAYRRRRHPAYKDVAGMVRSLHYAPNAHALQHAAGSAASLAAASVWYAAAARLYLTAYLDRVGDASFLPRDPAAREGMLAYFLIDKVLYELAYERASRPDWLGIPQAGIAQVERLVAA